MIKKLKVLILISIVTLAIGCNNKYKTVKNDTSDYHVIPVPERVSIDDGQFLIDATTAIKAGDNIFFEANYLANILKTHSGESISINDNGNITLKLDNSISNDEGYKLRILYKTVTITGKTPQGIFYGIQTLRQLLKKTTEGVSVLPSVSITDAPRFKYRGMHLDVGRRFFPTSYVKKYIDLIALHKMNTMHWHLTEDQGWRIEIKKYPKLTEIGSVRNGTIVGHYPGTENDNTRDGGFYTQEEVKEIVAYATERHVNVIPEIEIPGHSGAAIAAYPELSCFPNEVTHIPNNMMSKTSREEMEKGRKKFVQESWGVYNDVFVPNEETFKFLENVFSEVIALFPSKYIHIGGDECPKENWKKSKFCQNLIKKLGLKDEHELQSYFIQRMERFINSKGKLIIGWDEILEGGLAPNAVVMSWRGEKGGIEAAKQKHDVIMTPTTYCYFDYYQSKNTDNEPLAIGGYLPVKSVYNYEPIPTELSQEEGKYVLGAQGNVWTEYIADEKKLEYMVLPRMTALSEVVWSKKEAKNWESFKTRLKNMTMLYDELGYNYAKHVLEEK